MAADDAAARKSELFGVSPASRSGSHAGLASPPFASALSLPPDPTRCGVSPQVLMDADMEPTVLAKEAREMMTRLRDDERLCVRVVELALARTRVGHFLQSEFIGVCRNFLSDCFVTVPSQVVRKFFFREPGVAIKE